MNQTQRKLHVQAVFKGHKECRPIGNFLTPASRRPVNASTVYTTNQVLLATIGGVAVGMVVVGAGVGRRQEGPLGFIGGTLEGSSRRQAAFDGRGTF